MNLSNSEILTEAREHRSLVKTMEKDIREEAEKCARFLALKQWDETVITARGSRPTLTIDQLGQYKDQVINDWRRNRIGIKVSPADGPADDETARIIDGYIRQMEYQSRAHVAYDWALECCVGMNRGFIKLGSKRRKGSFKQDLCVIRIPNPLCVYMDPFAMDALDQRKTLIVDRLSHERFKAEYPRAQMVDFEGYSKDSSLADWVTKENVTVAEWWVLEEKPRKIQLLTKKIGVIRKGRALVTDTVYSNEWDPKNPQFQGVQVVVNNDGEYMEDDEPERIVWQYILNGVEVLEKTRWVGAYIPVVPMNGKEMFIDGKKKLFALLSRSLDSQQFLNYAVSSMAERLQQFPKNPIIGLTGQFKTDEKQWANMNTTPYAYLQYDPVLLPDGTYAATAPQRQEFDPRIDQFPMAIAMLKDLIKGTLGMYGSSLGQEDSKAKSGRAIEKLQQEGDNATFDFLDNGARAVETVGVMVVDALPNILSRPDIIQIRDAQNQVIQIAINQPVAQMANPPKDEHGKPQERDYNITEGQYHVMVSAAPSHQTLRQEGEELMSGVTDQLEDPNDRRKAVVARLRLSDAYGARELADELDPPKEGEQLPPAVMQKFNLLAKTLKAQTEEIDALKDTIDNKAVEVQASWREACLKAYVDLRKAEIAASKDLDKQDTDVMASRLEQITTQAHEVGMAAMQHGHAIEQAEVGHAQAMEQTQQAADLAPEPAETTE